MNEFASPELEDLAAFLRGHAFDCAVVSIGPFSRALLAEDPYALLLVVELHDDHELGQTASDAQAALTRIVSERDDRSKQWDLYVLIHLRTVSISGLDLEQIDRVSSDTAYARKLVRVNLRRDPAALAQALRPFLPISRVNEVSFDDPLSRLQALMSANGVPSADLDTAFALTELKDVSSSRDDTTDRGRDRRLSRLLEGSDDRLGRRCRSDPWR